MQKKLTLSIFMEGSCYVVQCIEHDIAAQGNSISDALNNWRLLFDIEKDRLNEIDPAPAGYLDYLALNS